MSEEIEEEMEEIPTTLIETLPEPPEGVVLEITNAEITQTLVRGFRGVRVEFKDKEGHRYATMLWTRQRVGDKSKLGAFVKILGKRPKEWIGKKIIIEEWRPRSRVVRLVKG